MDIFLKISAAVLLSVIASLILTKQGKEFSILLILCVCCMILGVAVTYFQKIFSFLGKLKEIGNLNGELVTILFKTVGIGIVSEIVTMICNDAGNQALGKALQITAAAIILWLCLPLFDRLIEMVENVLSAV